MPWSHVGACPGWGWGPGPERVRLPPRAVVLASGAARPVSDGYSRGLRVLRVSQNPDNAEEASARFKLIAEAYETLSDPHEVSRPPAPFRRPGRHRGRGCMRAHGILSEKTCAR